MVEFVINSSMSIQEFKKVVKDATYLNLEVYFNDEIATDDSLIYEINGGNRFEETTIEISNDELVSNFYGRINKYFGLKILLKKRLENKYIPEYSSMGEEIYFRIGRKDAIICPFTGETISGLDQKLPVEIELNWIYEDLELNGKIYFVVEFANADWEIVTNDNFEFDWGSPIRNLTAFYIYSPFALKFFKLIFEEEKTLEEYFDEEYNQDKPLNKRKNIIIEDMIKEKLNGPKTEENEGLIKAIDTKKFLFKGNVITENLSYDDTKFNINFSSVEHLDILEEAVNEYIGDYDLLSRYDNFYGDELNDSFKYFGTLKEVYTTYLEEVPEIETSKDEIPISSNTDNSEIKMEDKLETETIKEDIPASSNNDNEGYFDEVVVETILKRAISRGLYVDGMGNIRIYPSSMEKKPKYDCHGDEDYDIEDYVWRENKILSQVTESAHNTNEIKVEIKPDLIDNVQFYTLSIKGIFHSIGLIDINKYPDIINSFDSFEKSYKNADPFAKYVNDNYTKEGIISNFYEDIENFDIDYLYENQSTMIIQTNASKFRNQLKNYIATITDPYGEVVFVGTLNDLIKLKKLDSKEFNHQEANQKILLISKKKYMHTEIKFKVNGKFNINLIKAKCLNLRFKEDNVFCLNEIFYNNHDNVNKLNEKYVENIINYLPKLLTTINLIDNRLEGKTFKVIEAGPTKKLIDDKIYEYGGRIHNYVYKTTNFLVLGDPDWGGSHVWRANRLGTKTLTVEEFFKMVE